MHIAGRLSVAVGILAILAGCAPTLTLSLGDMPTADPRAVIEAGMSTRQEVRDLFGPPDLEGFSEDGLPTWTYTRAVLEVRKARDASIASFFNLKVTFKGDLVDSYTYDRKASQSP